jgi:hypothetical protein
LPTNQESIHHCDYCYYCYDYDCHCDCDSDYDFQPPQVLLLLLVEPHIPTTRQGKQNPQAQYANAQEILKMLITKLVSKGIAMTEYGVMQFHAPNGHPQRGSLMLAAHQTLQTHLL